MRKVIAPILLIVVGLTGWRWLQERPAGSQHTPPAFTFTKIRDDVYHAVGTGSMSIGSNSVVVINRDDVLLIDSHVSAAAAAVLLAELKNITTKPVRYVVNTHFHFDHAHGNQVFGPNVEVIGHRFTRETMAAGGSMRGRGYDRFVRTLPQTIASIRAQLDTASSAESKAALQRRLNINEQYKLATDATRAVPPNVAFDSELRLYRGGGEIVLYHFGRGHTGGDVVVHLPAEKVLATGDLLVAQLAYMGDAFVPDWIRTLDQLKRLDFDVILPGHGQPITRRARIEEFQAYLGDFWKQVSELYARGLPAAEAARQVDLRAHAPNFPALTAVGTDSDAVARAYELLSGR